MNCTTEDCTWRGELTSQRIAMIGSAVHCGLCRQPASPEDSSPVEVRRDEDAENQEELAASAAEEFDHYAETGDLVDPEEEESS